MEQSQSQKRTRDMCCLCDRTNLIKWIGTVYDHTVFIPVHNFPFLNSYWFVEIYVLN